MMSRLTLGVLAVVCSLSLVSGAFAGERVLSKEKAKKKEIRHSMMGFRNTLLFYVCDDAKAVLRLLIDNKTDAFPVSGTVYVFDENVTSDGLAKWLNNQHSDGLYPDVPEPIATEKLPEGVCQVAGKSFVAERENHFDKAKFREHDVKIVVKDHAVAGKYKIVGFTDSAKVYLKPQQ